MAQEPAITFFAKEHLGVDDLRAFIAEHGPVAYVGNVAAFADEEYDPLVGLHPERVGIVLGNGQPDWEQAISHVARQLGYTGPIVVVAGDRTEVKALEKGTIWFPVPMRYRDGTVRFRK